MITIAICDDDAYMREELSGRIRSYFLKEPFAITIREFTDGESLLTCMEPLDIIFLDIQMDKLNGMETAKKLRGQNFKGFLIFVTVLPELVYDAFAVQAYDYLVKPLQSVPFNRTMDRLAMSLKSRSFTHLLIQKNTETSLIAFDDILYCEIINRKIYLHLTQQYTIDYYEKLENLQQKLDRRFYRCHRSYLINLSHLSSYHDNSAYLTNGEAIPVSRLRKDAFSKAILNYMKDWRA